MLGNLKEINSNENISQGLRPLQKLFTHNPTSSVESTRPIHKLKTTHEVDKKIFNSPQDLFPDEEEQKA